MIHIGSRRECFFDSFLIDEEKTTAPAVLHHPEMREIVLKSDRPWETRGLAYFNFFKDEAYGKYRMYYLGRESTGPTIKDERIRVCYAESADGIHWEKPNLGIRAYKGSFDTNIIMGENDASGFFDNFYVFYDENPACPPEQRYKAVGEQKQALMCFYSADGINFTVGHEITRAGRFDSLNVAFYDKEIGKYRIFYRSMHAAGDEEGTDPFDKMPNAAPKASLEFRVRDIRYIESDDFVHFTEQRRLKLSGEDFPLYTNNIQSYPRAPHILVGFPARYYDRRVWSHAFDMLSSKEVRHKRVLEHPRYGMALTDCIFITSRDGIHFQRYNEAFVRPRAEHDGAWIYGDCYLSTGIAFTPSIYGENSDDEISLYCPDSSREKHKGLLRRMVIRQDGFVSRHAGEEEKVLVTKPFVFEGTKLLANISTSAVGRAIFKLETTDGALSTESTEIFGDRVDKPIAFYEPLPIFAGKEVVLTVKLLDADIYAIKFE